jgi:hypothetical protein
MAVKLDDDLMTCGSPARSASCQAPWLLVSGGDERVRSCLFVQGFWCSSRTAENLFSRRSRWPGSVI